MIKWTGKVDKTRYFSADEDAEAQLWLENKNNLLNAPEQFEQEMGNQ